MPDPGDWVWWFFVIKRGRIIRLIRIIRSCKFLGIRTMSNKDHIHHWHKTNVNFIKIKIIYIFCYTCVHINSTRMCTRLIHTLIYLYAYLFKKWFIYLLKVHVPKKRKEKVNTNFYFSFYINNFFVIWFIFFLMHSKLF